MTIPLWCLLIFALWTLVLLIVGVGAIRWIHIIQGDLSLVDYWKGIERGSDLYRRAHRAHANCIENLPVFGAIVLIISVLHLQSVSIDYLSLVFLVARLLQSSIHFLFKQTKLIGSLRFTLYLCQMVCMFWLAAEIIRLN